jgi:putative flavoprotein involved in K+ transport
VAVPEKVETVIVGAGQAGLSMSYHLRRLGREHVVLERGRIAERWRSERWDSLAFQFPNWMIRLPGYAYEGDEPDGFMLRDEVVSFMEDYAKRTAPPVRCGIEVTALKPSRGGRLLVEAGRSALDAANVVVATGPFQAPSVPAFGDRLPHATFQITANRYANPGQLPPGRVLVVGSGASGCQIAEDLLQGGREVYLSVGRHVRVPRRYRGKDFGWWQETMGALDRTVDTLPADDAHSPLLTGVRGGQDLDLRDIERRGVTLLGSLRDIHDGRLFFASDLEENLAAGDRAFDQFTRSVDEYILGHDLAVAEEPRPPATIRPSGGAPRDLDIGTSGIASVIWATGYRYDLRWIKCEAIDARGTPVHRRGVTPVPGVYFIGLRRLYKRKSSFLWGSGEDAAYLAEHIAARA